MAIQHETEATRRAKDRDQESALDRLNDEIGLLNKQLKAETDSTRKTEIQAELQDKLEQYNKLIEKS